MVLHRSDHPKSQRDVDERCVSVVVNHSRDADIVDAAIVQDLNVYVCDFSVGQNRNERADLVV